MPRKKRPAGLPLPRVQVLHDDEHRLFEVFVVESLSEDVEIARRTCRLQDAGRRVLIADNVGGIDRARDSWEKQGYTHHAGLIFGSLPSQDTSTIKT